MLLMQPTRSIIMALQPLPQVRPSRLPGRSILTDIVIDHGPTDVLGPFFLHVEMEARRRGVALEFCAAEDLVIANQENAHNWRPLMPMCNPANGHAKAEMCFNVIGRNEFGEIVTANSILKYDWQATDFVEEATSLRLLYAEPDRMRRVGEQCLVTAEEARTIRGKVAYSGAAWVRPDYRNRGLAQLLPRFIKAYGSARWELDWIFGMMAKDVHVRGFASRFGYDQEAWDLNWVNSIWGGHMQMAILWTTVDSLANDIRASLDAGAAPQIDGAVLKRNAQ
jgi:GNAT superfamily N-acetyltransferase